MKYQKRYKPKTKFEKFLKVYFIIGILVIVLTGVYAGVKSMQRKKEAASETIIHTVAVPKISLKKIEWAGKKRFVDCEFEPIKGAKRYYIAMSSNRNYTGCTEISGEPDDNTKNIVFRIEQSRWKAGHPECAFTFSSAYDICLFFDISSYGHQYVGILHILLLFLG